MTLDTLWHCEVCGELRLDEWISAMVYKDRFSATGGSLGRNVRYCNDRHSCLRGALLLIERFIAEHCSEGRHHRARRSGVSPGPREALQAVLTEREQERHRQTTGTVAVHILRYGHALCGRPGFPGLDWPAGHAWVSDEQKNDATCPACIHAFLLRASER